MKESEYKRLKAQIEAEYRKKLDALDLVWKMSQSSSATLNGNGDSAARGPLARQVGEFVSLHVGEFSVLDVERKLRDSDPNIKRPSIATALRRMQRKGDIELTKAGSGRTPSMYKRAQAIQ